jgi:hypothetical protein
MYDLAGTTAVFATKSPLARLLRDAITMSQHLLLGDAYFEMIGGAISVSRRRTLEFSRRTDGRALTPPVAGQCVNAPSTDGRRADARERLGGAARRAGHVREEAPVLAGGRLGQHARIHQHAKDGLAEYQAGVHTLGNLGQREPHGGGLKEFLLNRDDERFNLRPRGCHVTVLQMLSLTTGFLSRSNWRAAL